MIIIYNLVNHGIIIKSGKNKQVLGVASGHAEKAGNSLNRAWHLLWVSTGCPNAKNTKIVTEDVANLAQAQSTYAM